VSGLIDLVEHGDLADMLTEETRDRLLRVIEKVAQDLADAREKS
jgi:hypothetical protein